MAEARGYRWGASFFALATICGLAVLPFAISCCSRFTPEQSAESMALGGNGWAPGITPVAVALLDWPMGFRLLVMMLAASLLCFSATIAMLLISRSKLRGSGSLRRAGPAWGVIAQAVLSSFMVGLLYILAVYVTGFAGYVGPANLVWMAGIPMAVGFMARPRLSGLALGVPLALGGWVCLGIISMTVGIPLD